jgi:DNA-binding transcriptional MerR regulator
MSYPIGRVAGLAGVTVRTLHHYDEIGLLTPGDRSRAGYRRYDDADLRRLQQILFYRELGFALDEIAVMLDDPDTDPTEHLRRQHELLTARRDRVQEMVAAVEKAMEADKMGISLTPEERFEVFGDTDPSRYADEAEQRWGQTDAYKQSQRRTKAYSKDDWLKIKAESAEITTRMGEAYQAGAAADSETAMDLAERHRQHITRWFYDCSYEIHRGLGEMYVSDERFAANYEPIAAGLTQWIRDAIVANAERH